MKALVNSLSSSVRRFPVVVIVVVVAISMVLGGLSQQFTPEEDSNESFAPDAPELNAVDVISDRFGEESSIAVMQVIVTAEGGNVIGLEGLEAVGRIEEAVRRGAYRDVLVNEDADAGGQPAVISFLIPAQLAIGQGAPAPTTDAELQKLYLDGLAQVPEDQAGFARQLLPGNADSAAATSGKGLMIILTTGAESTDEFDQFVDLSALAADEIEAVDLPEGITAEAFSFELLFADQDEFEGEVNRLFGMAGLIIATVLASVFLILPRRRGLRALVPAGFGLIVLMIALSILPTLAKISSIFPESLADWPENGLFLGAVGAVVLSFVVWAAGSKLLRRTVADTMVTLVTIFFAIGWMNGIGYLLFEDANPMALILPILLIGLGVDYSIHLTSRYREEMAEDDATVDDAISTGIKTVGIALVLATVTTAVGFLTNLTNDIPALREFGALAAIGILASFLLMLTFVPAVRELLDRRGARRGTLEVKTLEGQGSRALPQLIGKTSFLARRLPAGVVVASLVLAAFGAWGVTRLETKFSFIDFIPTTSPLRTTFQTILDDFGGGFGESTQVLIEGDVASAEAWNAMVDANAALVTTANVVTFAGNPAGSSPVALINQLGRPESASYAPDVGAALTALGADQASLKLPAGASMASVYDAAAAVAPVPSSGVLYRAANGTYESALFDITTQAGEAGANQMRSDTLAAFSKATDAGLDVVATSDEIINDVIVTTLRDSQLSSLLLTIVAALVLLIINFWVEARRPVLGVLTTIPVALVVLLSFAIMALIGIPFGPVTATIAALAIGIGIPYMIHITHRFLEDRGKHDTVEDAIESTLTHTGGALAGSALTTVAGFGILVTSTTIPFRQFGFVTAYTILLAMLAAVLILPSTLVLWDRWHRNRGEDPFDAESLDEALQRQRDREPA